MKIDRKIKTPLYIQVYERLLVHIRDGHFAQGAYLPSEKELGAAFRVDRQTVRRALQLLVHDGVVRKMAGLGTLVADLPPARAARGARSAIAAFILPRSRTAIGRITEPFIASLFAAMEDECAAQGLSLAYAAAGPEDDLRSLLTPRSVAGAFFVSAVDSRILGRARHLRIPFVVVNHRIPNALSVLPDTEQGAYLATACLVGAGHRRIAHIQGPQGYLNSTYRARGFHRALAEAGIEAVRGNMRVGDWTFDGGYKAMRAILERRDRRPTAVFAANDMMALGAIEAVRAAGLDVPRDVSVIGFDDVEQSRHAHPSLSTVQVDTALMARAAVHHLKAQIGGFDADGLQILIPVRLVLRNSSGPAPGVRSAARG